MDVLINSMVGILSQYIHISNHHIVHVKRIIILFVSYTSITFLKHIFNLFLLEHSFFTMLRSFLLYSKVDQPYACTRTPSLSVFRPFPIKWSTLSSTVCSHQLPILPVVSIVYIRHCQPPSSSHPTLLSPMVSMYFFCVSLSLFVLPRWDRPHFS